MELRDYQLNSKLGIERNWLEGIRRQLLVMPTGAGKTVLFSAIANEFVKQGFPVLVVAHREELISQAAEKLQTVTKQSPGIIKAGYKPDPSSLIQIASIQSLQRREFPPADLVIIDEAHHASAPGYKKLIASYPQAKILGVTATPCRMDGYGFRDCFDELVIGTTTQQLIAEGFLTPYKLYAAFSIPGMNSQGRSDYTKDQLKKAATKLQPQDVAHCWFGFCYGRKTIIFCCSVEHSKAVTAEFLRCGISCEHVDGETPDEERRLIFNRFHNGQTTVLTNCAIATEGLDIPTIEAVMVGRPTQSLALWLQMIGRGLRPSPGKEYAVIADLTDSWSRLGLPDAPRNWTLEPQSVDDVERPGVRVCEQCRHAFTPNLGSQASKSS